MSVIREGIASSVLMIQPLRFGFNEETAMSNSFQNLEFSNTRSAQTLQEAALEEFRNFVALLRNAGIEVHVFEDTPEPHTPDSIFPNNWFSTHGGQIITYPMATSNRAAERRDDILTFLTGGLNLPLRNDLLAFESRGRFLEGTGSLVIDHGSKTAFAALSPRTDQRVLEAYCVLSGNELVSFRAFGPAGEAIYHTNVLMCIGDEFALIGSECIHPEDRETVLHELERRGKTIIELSREQIYTHFAGNMLQLQNQNGERFIVLSERAKNSLNSAQLASLERLGNQFISPKLDVIEQIGGGSARCMLAELF